jgi:hypothetical protein
MDGRTATIAAVGVAALGVIAFVVLSGVGAGLVLFVAGVVLVAIGIFGWDDHPPAVAAEGSTGAVALSARARDEDDDMTPHHPGGDVAPHDAADVDDRSTRADAGASEDASRDLLSGSEEDDAGSPPEPVSEEIPAPHPYVGGVEAVADPLGRGETDSTLDLERAADDAEVDVPATPGPDAEPTMILTGASDLDHVHDEPLRNHTDLVRHVADYHPGVPTDGSTIQLRLLHEREHGVVAEP